MFLGGFFKLIKCLTSGTREKLLRFLFYTLCFFKQSPQTDRLGGPFATNTDVKKLSKSFLCLDCKNESLVIFCCNCNVLTLKNFDLRNFLIISENISFFCCKFFFSKFVCASLYFTALYCKTLHGQNKFCTAIS